MGMIFNRRYRPGDPTAALQAEELNRLDDILSHLQVFQGHVERNGIQWTIVFDPYDPEGGPIPRPLDSLSINAQPDSVDTTYGGGVVAQLRNWHAPDTLDPDTSDLVPLKDASDTTAVLKYARAGSLGPKRDTISINVDSNGKWQARNFTQPDTASLDGGKRVLIRDTVSETSGTKFYLRYATINSLIPDGDSVSIQRIDSQWPWTYQLRGFAAASDTFSPDTGDLVPVKDIDTSHGYIRYARARTLVTVARDCLSINVDSANRLQLRGYRAPADTATPTDCCRIPYRPPDTNGAPQALRLPRWGIFRAAHDNVSIDNGGHTTILSVARAAFQIKGWDTLAGTTANAAGYGYVGRASGPGGALAYVGFAAIRDCTVAQIIDSDLLGAYIDTKLPNPDTWWAIGGLKARCRGKEIGYGYFDSNGAAVPPNTRLTIDLRNMRIYRPAAVDSSETQFLDCGDSSDLSIDLLKQKIWRQYKDTAGWHGALVIDIGGKILRSDSSAGGLRVNWGTGALYDSGGIVLGVDWFNRKCFDDTGDTVIGWDSYTIRGNWNHTSGGDSANKWTFNNRVKMLGIRDTNDSTCETGEVYKDSNGFLKVK